MNELTFKWLIFLTLIISLVSVSSVSATMGTPINSTCIITESGYYYLTGDIYCDIASSTVIDIKCSNVTIDGNGFSVNGGNSSSCGIRMTRVSNITVQDVNVSDFKYYGIFLTGVTDSIISNNTLNSNNDSGIYLYSSSDNNITGNTVNSNIHGIKLASSPNNDITGNTVNSNSNSGIYMGSLSSGNTIVNNIVNSNGDYGIYVSSPNNDITGNTVNSNYYGIYPHYSSNNTISGNIVDSNNYGIYLYSSSDNNINNNTFYKNGIYIYGTNIPKWNTHTIENNTVNGKQIYCFKNSFGETVPEDAGQVILLNCSEMKIENLNLSNTSVGILLGYSSGNAITGNTVNSNSDSGIYLYSSSNNNITGNTVNSNSIYGIHLSSSSSNNNITGNTVNSNGKYGIYLYYSDNSQIFGNIFNNSWNAFTIKGRNCWNTLAENGGGNYWLQPDGNGFSEKCPDEDGDGYCDFPYTINGANFDFLPIAFVLEGVNEDTTAPDVTINSPDEITYFESSVPINVTVTDDLSGVSSGVAEIDGITNITLESDEDYYIGNTGDLSNGIHTLRIFATDDLGNLNSTECVEFEISILKEYNLCNNLGESFGILTVYVKGDILYFTYNVNQNLTISEIHLMALDESPENTKSRWYTEKYLTKTGNPKVGQFKIKASEINSAEYSGTLNLAEINVEPRGMLYISAHAVLTGESDSEGSSLWTDGTDFSGGNWAMYVIYPLE